MEWQTDFSKVKHNEWHICHDAVSNRSFSAMAVILGENLKWIVDPYCRAKYDQFFVRVTHFIHYPEGPSLSN
jgi:hypothetical protein